MPCDQVILNRVEYKNADVPILKAALVAMGYQSVTQSGKNLTFQKDGQVGYFQNGVFQVPQGWNVDAIKVAYSTEAVKRVASKYSWTLKKTGVNKYQTIRRSF